MKSSGPTPGLLCRWLLLAELLLLALYWLVYAKAPEFHQHYFRGEDKLIEWITFAGFAAAGVMVLRILRYRATMDLFVFLYMLGMGLFFLVCAGEELSWGQRIFGFGTPEKFTEINEQQEFNLHNLSFEHIHPLDIVSWLMKIFGIILPLLFWRKLRQPEAPLRLYFPPAAVAPAFILAEVLTTVARKLKPVLANRWGEELANVVRLDTAEYKEMCWSLAVLLAAWSLREAWRRQRGSGDIL